MPLKPKLVPGQKSFSNDDVCESPTQTSGSKIQKPPTPPKKPEWVNSQNSFDEKKSDELKKQSPDKSNTENAASLSSNTGNVDIQSHGTVLFDPKANSLSKKESFNFAVALKIAADRKLGSEGKLVTKTVNAANTVPPKPPPSNTKPKFKMEKHEDEKSVDATTTTSISTANILGGDKTTPPKPPPKVMNTKINVDKFESEEKVPPSKLPSKPTENTDKVDSLTVDSKGKRKWFRRSSGDKSRKVSTSDSIKEGDNHSKNKKRKPSAKFYTDSESSNGTDECCITGGSTFYRSSNNLESNEESHEQCQPSNSSSIQDSVENQSNQNMVSKNSKPSNKALAPPSKRNVFAKTVGVQNSSDSDPASSVSPQLPRKTVNVRDSVVMSSNTQSHTPVAPIRKKKTMKKRGPFDESAFDSGSDISIDDKTKDVMVHDKAVSVVKKQHVLQRKSSSFTTEDFDVFQRKYCFFSFN